MYAPVTLENSCLVAMAKSTVVVLSTATKIGGPPFGLLLSRQSYSMASLALS